MFSKIGRIIILVVLALSFNLFNSSDASAASNSVMWGKTELKLGQVGKITILKPIELVKLNSDGSLSNVRTLTKGEEFRVYSYKSNHGGLYGVGGGSFVQNSTNVKYETPSKSKLALLNGTENNIQVPTPLNEVEIKKPSEVINAVEKINNGAELANYLGKNYSELQTNLIKVDFGYVVYENDSVNLPYDYEIELGIDYFELERAMNAHLRSIKYADTAKSDVELARKQFKDFLEKMAKDVIGKMPNKKIFGHDTEVSYTYPALKMDKLTVKSYSWTNYEPVGMKQIWPGDEPDDFYSVMSATRDPSSSKVIQYSQDDKARRFFTSEYVTLGYNDFKISEFSWKSYLDGTHFSKY